MKLLEDIKRAEQTAAAALAATADLKTAAEKLAEAIARAPAPRTWPVSVRGEERVLSESDALAVLAGFIVAINETAPVRITLRSGDHLEAGPGDIEVMARQILAGPDGAS